jgi:hypothetical protein
VILRRTTINIPTEPEREPSLASRGTRLVDRRGSEITDDTGGGVHTLAVTPGTPKAIVDKLYTETAAYMRLPETLKTLTGMGVDVDVKATAEVRKFVRDEIVKWRKVAIDAKMPREVD